MSFVRIAFQNRRYQLLGMTLALGAIAAFIAADMLTDYREGGSTLHLTFEGLSFLIAITASLVLSRSYLELRRENSELSVDLNRFQTEAAQWRARAQNYIHGLSIAIDEQFSKWNLTPAEKEIAFMLLKGLSFKEMAEALQKRERTVRQQSLEIYKKSKLAGRAELSAFFLEDLLTSPITIRKSSLVIRTG